MARIARAYAELMARLGYGRYGAHGGDWGARIVPELARLDQQHVAGIHLHGFVAFPAGDPGDLTATEQQRLGRLRHWQAERGGYAAIQGSRPQTLAYAMADSPAGLLGWYLEWFDDYGEHVGAIGNDQILTNVTSQCCYLVTRVDCESRARAGTRHPRGVRCNRSGFRFPWK